MLVHSNFVATGNYLHPFLEKNLASRRILIIGASERIEKFYHEIAEHSMLNARVLGYLDNGEYVLADLPKLGSADELGNILRDNVVDVIVVGLPIRASYDVISKTIATAELHGTLIIFPFGFFENIGPNLSFSNGTGQAVALRNDRPLISKDFAGQAISRIFSTTM